MNCNCICLEFHEWIRIQLVKYQNFCKYQSYDVNIFKNSSINSDLDKRMTEQTATKKLQI